MVNIAKVTGNIFEKTLSGKGKITQKTSRFLSRKFEEAINDPAKFASSMLLTSIVSKDVVGCILYTTQSATNKEIPADKRPSVACWDFMNGFLMVGGQVAAGKIVENKIIPTLFGKHYSGTFKDKITKVETDLTTLKGSGATAKSKLTEDNVLGLVEARAEKQGIKLKQGESKKVAESLIKELGNGSGRYKLLEAGFGIILTALFTTALVKRTLVPLVSTPLSAWFRKTFVDKRLEKKEQEQMTPAMMDATMPKVEKQKETNKAASFNKAA